MRPAAGLLLAALASVALAGCAETAPTIAPASATSPASVLATASASAPSTAGPGPTGSAAGDVVEDPSLLGLLPADVGGIPINLEHQAFLEAAADPAFAHNVRRAAFGVAVKDSDLVSGVVAELEPGRFDDAFFRDWRETYDAGACGQAGGVTGNAEADIGGRTVYIASCAGGLHTYHAWVPERGAIVSAFSLGEHRLGEALMEGLRP